VYQERRNGVNQSDQHWQRCRLCCEAHLQGMVSNSEFAILDLMVLNTFFAKVEGRLKVEQSDFL
jgi:hypothetical protein